MRDINLLQLALGLTPPWTVTRSDFDPRRSGSTSRSTSRPAAVSLSQLRRCRLPRLRHRADELAPPELLPAPGLPQRPRAARPLRQVRHQEGPRSLGAPDSGFTLLFEALLMTMVSAMPVKTVARMVGGTTRLWRVLHHYVDQARAPDRRPWR